MKNFLISHIYILIPVILLAYTNLVLKDQINKLPQFTGFENGSWNYFYTIFTNPWVISTLITGALSLLAWILALNKFPLSYAYPMVVSLSFSIVALGGVLLMGEKISTQALIGLILIISGVILTASTQS